MSEKGINQVELAKKSGIKQPLLSHYLRESKWARFPSLKNLLALARALNCTLEQLTGLESLHGIEQKVQEIKSGKVELSERGKQLAKLYNGLTDETLKQFVEDMILKAAERETKKGGEKPKK